MSDTTSNNEFFSSLAGDKWIADTEGQLSIDVIETATEILINSAIAGVSSDDLEINVTPDTITIRGERKLNCKRSEADTIHIQECYWGTFSRSIVLPCNVQPDATEAELKNGILTIRLKKAEMNSNIPVLDLD